MEIIYKPRRSGKTIKMLQLLAQDRDRVLLTFSAQEATRLQRENPDLAHSIFYWEIWLRDQYGRSNPDTKVLIDNADYVLQNYIRYPIEIVSFSDKNNQLYKESLPKIIWNRKDSPEEYQRKRRIIGRF